MERSGASKAFIIGPIGDRDAAIDSKERRIFEEAIVVWEEIIVPACDAFGFESIRADTIAKPGEIPDQIFRLLRDAEVVIADLTGANPNVMYELGLRHTTGKLTIQIGERGRLPFDVSVIRTILFKRSEAGYIDARRRLSLALGAGLEDGGDPVASTRIWYESTALVPIDRGASDEEDEEFGFLEKLAEMEEGITATTSSINHIATITIEMAGLFTQGTADIGEVNRKGGGAASRLNVANKLATQLEVSASQLEVVVGDYVSSLRRVDPGMQYMLQRIREDSGERAVAKDFLSTVGLLIETATGTLPNTRTFKDTVYSMGAATRAFRRVATRIAASLQRFIDSVDTLVAWQRLLELIPSDVVDLTQVLEPVD